MYYPGSVHRIDWIFDSPRFTVGGYSSSDIKQGGNGDCWWLAAVATIAHRKDLMDRVCVARDEECGVYGFVFQRDGEWISVVVDDNLYLNEEDFDYYGDVYDSTGKRARRHRKEKQTGSEALYFARCEDQNETWLPLLEKAYAKVHGDYEAISGGWSGEAVEDMTGGVTTTVASNRVLRKDALWKELQSSGDGDFVFAVSAMGTGWDRQKSGLALGHAYSVLQAREEVDEDGNKVRLVQIRNPWGQRSYSGLGEWNGPWADGSSEWTPYWLKKMDHKFGDDGVFWMSYKDMLETFMFLHRTRLFDDRWTIVQQWTSANVSWITGYLQSKFEIVVKKSGLVVIVLTQLDERYFTGLEGEYRYELHFILRAAAEDGSDAASQEHICRVRPIHTWENRSVSCEVELDAGKYFVLPKVTASRRDGSKPVEQVVKEYADQNPQKLRQIGMQYDLAHARGGVPDEDELLISKKEAAKRKKDAMKKKRKEKNRKVLRQAAKAIEKVAVAIQEVTKEEEGAGAKKAEEKKVEGSKSDEAAAKPTAPASTAAAVPASAPAAAPSAPESAKPEPPATASAPPKDAPPPAEKEAEEEKKAEEAVSSSSEGTANVTPTSDDEVRSDAAVDGDTAAETVEEPTVDKEVVEEEEEDESDSDSSDDGVVDDEDTPAAPWNAVVVMGLRVYARDAEVCVKLVETGPPAESNALTVQGQPAGATM
ncbi:hypothetical protein Micbo1qcDRAFT_165318 [Microdochium bolleyi]|uniref:Calpain catalytic domain-containing protein n=1 Tax=Microdochium bolleyi TaxID=196109 RepID=A0A136IWN2_9PEZI|nr:hypothetical protein Micbo1qcDRAFT_165318 [Microdochium bolleyi]